LCPLWCSSGTSDSLSRLLCAYQDVTELFIIDRWMDGLTDGSLLVVVSLGKEYSSIVIHICRMMCNT
jgi:hypothetical protein